MRVPLSWLKDFVDIPADVLVEELAERLTLAGLEIGKIDYIGVPQGQPDGIVVPPSDHLVWERDKLVLGFIHEVKPHPDADRLVLAMVDHGTGEVEQIVTGAPNLHPYSGQGELKPPLLCPIAREGARVYDGHASEPGQVMVLEEREIRGIPNRHMVCSEMELGISDAHEGILLLDHDTYGDVAPGTPLQDVIGDVVLDIDLTPNLARCFSILGVAREVAALLNVPLKEPNYDFPEANGNDIEAHLAIEIQDADLNPRFTAMLLKNVEIKASPYWMQQRLKLIGQRPINNIVDVTNYVMFEIGQPTHAFDYDVLKDRASAYGDTPTIVTRLAQPGESLTTLDGKDYQLDTHNLLVADPSGALSMAGVMGGLESEVYDAATELLDATGVEMADDDALPPGKIEMRSESTQNVLLESAAWNFINIRQTLSSTKMHSEASARFSRGVHPAMARRGVLRGAQLMAEVSGAQIVPGVLDVYPSVHEDPVIELPLAEISRILGFAIPKEDVVTILENLQFGVADHGEHLTVSVPDHRLDIGTGTIGQADLIEEIARIYGYNRIPDTQISDSLPPQRNNPSLELEEHTRDVLANAGLRETISYRLTTPEREAKLTPDGQASSWPDVAYVELANPISADKTVMRHTLLAGLMEVAVLNDRFQGRQALFEIGNVYFPVAGELLPDEPTRLAMLMMGGRHIPNWQAQNGQTMDFYDLRGVVEALLKGLYIDKAEILPTEHNTYHPGRVAKLVIEGQEIGVFGEVHPLVREAYGLELDLARPVLAGEFDLDALLAHSDAMHDIQAIITQPAVYQDMSLVVAEKTPAADIEKVIWETGGDLLVDVRLFDVYRGESIPDGHKSLAYSLTYQHPEETLTDKQVSKIHNKIVKAVEKSVGAKLRA